MYFYGEETMPEKDYILSRKRFTDELKEVDERLAELKSHGTDDTMSDEFIQKASILSWLKTCCRRDM